MHDYGSFINLKALYITNDLIDLYLPMHTILISAGLFILWRVYKAFR